MGNIRFDDAVKELDGTLLERVRELSAAFLEISSDGSLPIELKSAANTAHGRLNVAAFEIEHALDAVSSVGAAPETTCGSDAVDDVPLTLFDSLQL